MFKKIQYNSPVVLTYFFVSVIVLWLSNITNGSSDVLLFSVYRSSIGDVLAYIRLFTHILGHADYTHFFNNFVMILLLGPTLEEKYGSKNLLIMIIITAFITGIFHIMFSHTMLLGASGVLFMFIILSSYTNYQKGRIPITLIFILIMFIGEEVVNSFYKYDNISYFSHILGGFCGLILGFLFNNKAVNKKIV